MKKKKKPQTLNDRLKNLFIDKGSVIPFDDEEKKKLGKIVVSAFFSKELNIKHRHLPKTTVIEDGKEMTVMLYPSFFVPVMDALIYEYLNSKKDGKHTNLGNWTSPSLTEAGSPI